MSSRLTLPIGSAAQWPASAHARADDITIRSVRVRYEVDGTEASHAVQYVDAVYFAVRAAVLPVGTVCCCRPPLLLSVYTAGVDCDVSNGILP